MAETWTICGEGDATTYSKGGIMIRKQGDMTIGGVRYLNQRAAEYRGHCLTNDADLQKVVSYCDELLARISE